MNKHVAYETRDGVAIVTIDNPPKNTLRRSVRRGLLQAIERAVADPVVGAVLICAKGRTFPTGVDAGEFEKAQKRPLLSDLCARIEASPKPVVAALHGKVMGGGFELALACHWRLADDKTIMGFPEVTLGLLPSAGGTQRLPRIIGAGAALEMLLSGKPATAETARKVNLIDKVVTGDLFEAGLVAARNLVRDNAPPRPTSDRLIGFADPATYIAQVAEQRKGLTDGVFDAPARIVECVEAAMLLPLEGGLALEQAAFAECVVSDASRALRHGAMARRRAGRVPELVNASIREINTIGIVGAGLMGAGIAVACLNADYPVTLVERDEETLLRGVERIDALYDRAVAKGRITAETRDARMQRLHGTTNMRAFEHSDLVIEAVSEDEDAKRAVFAALDAVMKPGAILATNTSYLDINTLAATISRPEDVVGLHFFSPAHIMKLLEIVVADKTGADVVATGFDLARRLGKVAVRAGVCDGFIANRMLTAYRTAADFMLEDGATPGQIDAAMRAYGFPQGPYQVLDMAGLDISWARRKRLAPTRDRAARYVSIGDILCERGRFGHKAGRGYYRYDTGTNLGKDDQDVLDLINTQRTAKGISARHFDPAEIQRRCLNAMANEGARLLEEGIAQHPSDIDVVMLYGFGFPRWRGGPMFEADLRGLLEVEIELRNLAVQDPHFWTPSPLFNELIKNGRTFGWMNRD